MSSRPKTITRAEELAESREKVAACGMIQPIALSPLATDPLVSVLVANYNYGRYIGEALESVLRQTYRNFEAVVCDDGSKDDSCEVVARYCRADSRVKLIAKCNGGMASALNAAYEKSAGRIICFLDADDRWLPTKLSIAVGELCQNPKSGFLSHRLYIIDAVGRRRGATPIITDPPSGWFGSRVLDCTTLPPGLSPSSGLCIRREVSDLIFPISESFRANADGVVLHVAPLITPIIGVPLPLGEYRVHGNNMTVMKEGRADAKTIEIELAVNKGLWNAQHNYLKRLDPRIAEAFGDFDDSWAAIRGSYIMRKLRDEGSAFEGYRKLLASPGFRTAILPLRICWRASILLPRPVFRAALRVYKSQGRVRRFAAWVSRLKRWRPWSAVTSVRDFTDNLLGEKPAGPQAMKADP